MTPLEEELASSTLELVNLVQDEVDALKRIKLYLKIMKQLQSNFEEEIEGIKHII